MYVYIYIVIIISINNTNNNNNDKNNTNNILRGFHSHAESPKWVVYVMEDPSINGSFGGTPHDSGKLQWWRRPFQHGFVCKSGVPSKWPLKHREM